MDMNLKRKVRIDISEFHCSNCGHAFLDQNPITLVYPRGYQFVEEKVFRFSSQECLELFLKHHPDTQHIGNGPEPYFGMLKAEEVLK